MNSKRNMTFGAAPSRLISVQRDDIIGKLHDRLYNNIRLLTFICPPSPEFVHVFKTDMFMKNNKAAFHQVVYYLLHILNPETIKEKITTWPIYEVRMEATFRSEVLAYINELRSVYSDVEIPHIMASHLVTAGGIKFVRFMLKLSILVLHEMLKSNAMSVDLLTPIKLSKNPAVNKVVLENLKTDTLLNEVHTDKIIQNFEEKAEEYQVEAIQLSNELDNINDELKAVKEELETHNGNEFDAQFLKEIAEIGKKAEIVEQMANNSTKCSDQIQTISNNDLLFEFDKNKKLPNLARIQNNSVDLAQFLSASTNFLKNRLTEFPHYPPTQLGTNKLITAKLNNQSLRLVEKLEEKKDKLSAIETSVKTIKSCNLAEV